MIATSRVASPLGAWTLWEHRPEPDDALFAVVARIWLFAGTTVFPRERVFPDGTLEIVVQLQGGYRPVREVPAAPFPPLTVAGLRLETLVIEGPAQPVRVLGMRLRPGGAFALLRTSLRPLVGADLELESVVGRAARELADRCATARTGAHCVQAARDWAAARIARAAPTPPTVGRVLAEIEAHRGDVAIAALGALAGRSRARVGANFRDAVGVTPKRYARLVRFKHALDLLDDAALGVGAIAAQAGFADQSHLDAEFRAHAGMSPSAYRAARRYPNSNSLAEHYLQDAGDATV